ncbi:hypothetical protein QQS21_005625 [Conoideocrella luteorostrata]|uniref:Uncharacterized protein n=1 Tax=Conoideocrella luteorostrata TaxID=1105319 RepID=A0AAJ0CP66_9HYPO|nr:hypothetical protein QQS21_005625 [Conoideocrella luteorostrata]
MTGNAFEIAMTGNAFEVDMSTLKAMGTDIKSTPEYVPLKHAPVLINAHQCSSVLAGSAPNCKPKSAPRGTWADLQKGMGLWWW